MPLYVNYEKLKSERDNYGWRVKTETFDTLGYDIKFGYHTIRILAEGLELLTKGRIDYPISGKYREDIMRIRNAEVSLQELLTMHDEYATMCEKALENTVLRKKPDFNWANKYLIDTLKNNIMEE